MSDPALPTAAYVLALAGLPGVGPVRLGALLRSGSPERTWTRLAEHDEVPSDSDVGSLWRAHAEAGVGVSWCGGPGYPDEAFASLESPPPLLLWAGDLDVLAGARVAIVGTRSSTNYGRELAHHLGGELAAAGVAVVSGLAAGIDTAAHQGALGENDGAPPIGVVASGLDVPYPRQNERLWNRVAQRGVLLTEALLGTRPERWRFPARNRLIAALADVVVVVESHRRGGAAITARLAMAQGRTVLAVPGPVHSAASAGCHDLIADGVGICRDVSDVLVALGMSPGVRRRASDQRRPPSKPAARVLEAAGWQPVTVSRLVTATGLGVGEVAAHLDDLVRDGWMRASGGWFERIARGIGGPP